MSRRYKCPKHAESTPSAVVYGDGFFCFGCGARGSVTELGLEPGERIEYTYKEDVTESIAAIKCLPTASIRGFDLHCDSRGYYLLFPGDTYYKRRLYGADASSKYRGPSGHKKPWFQAKVDGCRQLVLVEGEFNAMSLALLNPELDVMSPGGAGDFYSNLGKQMLDQCLHYDKIYIIVDNDGAGVKAAIEAKSHLICQGKNDVSIILVKEDFNDVLQKEGKEGLERYVNELGVPIRLRRERDDMRALRQEATQNGCR